MNKGLTYPVCLLARVTFVAILMSFPAYSAFSQALTVETKDVKCKGDATGEATVTGGKAPQPYTYKWSHNTGASAKTVKDLRAGMYTVTVTDALGCTGTVDFEIDEPDDAVGTILVSSDPYHDFCANTFEITVTAYGSGGKPPYSWPSGRVKTITGPGRYCFITQDANGCVDSECTHMGQAKTACRASLDPNDIAGPYGYDVLQWMSKFEKHTYVIRFENDPVLATGPAQYVEVRHDIDPKINPLSVRLSSFGFGPYLFDVPENASFYQNRLDLVDELGIYLDVVGGLDIVANQVFWRLETIDPATGLRPIDLSIGFLPPNDTLINDGQGFVTFSVFPKSTTVTRDTVSAEAVIIFDMNAPISTNIWHNTIDAVAPASVLSVLPDTTEGNLISLTWSASDDPGGCGIASFNLFASADSDAFYLVQEGITDTQYIYEGQYGVHYDFYIISIDHTGNKEVKTSGEAGTLVKPLKDIQIISPLSEARCVLDTLPVHWTTVLIDTVDIYVSIDSGQTFTLLGDSIPASASPYIWVIPDSVATMHAQFKLISPSALVERTGPLFSINVLPDVDAGPDMNLCINDFTNLIASGANMYSWTPTYSIDEPLNYKTLAYPDTSTTYYVQGTNVFGCKNVDSVTLTVLPIYLDSTLHEMCNEDSVFIGGSYQTEPGFYTDYLSTSAGCDSTVVTEVILTGPCAFPAPQVYVDQDATGLNNGTSWANAFVNLQDALEAVEYYVDVTDIWVAEGDYFPSVPTGRNASFTLRDSVKIYGGFVGTEILLEDRTGNETIVKLSGDLGTSNDSLDNAYHVIRIDSSCVDCIINSLTIKFGQGDGVNEQTYGAGLYVEGDVTLDGVTVERNTTLLEGAAIFNSGAGTLLTIRDCLFRLNTSSLARDILNTNGAEIRFEGMNTVED